MQQGGLRFDAYVPEPRQGLHCFLEDFQTWYANGHNGAAMPTGDAFLLALIELRQFVNPNDDGESEIAWANYEQNIGVVGGQLRFVAIQFRSTLSKDAPVGVGVPVPDAIHDFVEAQKANSPHCPQECEVPLRLPVRILRVQ